MVWRKWPVIQIKHKRPKHRSQVLWLLPWKSPRVLLRPWNFSFSPSFPYQSISHFSFWAKATTTREIQLKFHDYDSMINDDIWHNIDMNCFKKLFFWTFFWVIISNVASSGAEISAPSLTIHSLPLANHESDFQFRWGKLKLAVFAAS